MAIPGDAHYVPGTGRRSVRLGDGSIVSRQTAENAYARERGFGSDYGRRGAIRASKAAGGYQRDLDRARAAGTSRRDFDNARARLYAELKANGGNWRARDNSPDGPTADYLKSIGRRSDTDNWNVGDSPGIR